ncbi:DNA-binding response OmpR family regulator [Stella humosa]|uniref:Regulatory protein VirG n=1 Tax=Stella humosa TaxID=94 RepID=A0A3N1MEJ2_9PROT|nr:response regulator transcription factor [Stella humosa]ROQ01978.1 DNA-binding response OmpR family regulator [Stella humosa]BBK32367.1 DNA-binding response regulator [Stella humosa]
MTAGPAHILVVDDEADVRSTIADYLRLHGLRASTADGGRAMRAILAADRVDLVLLDIRMPDEDGLTLARELRGSHPVGIIMATAAIETIDRVVGLELGADDYLAKPLDLRELLARVRAVLRRRGVTATPRPAPDVRFGQFRFDPEGRRLSGPDGGLVRLTRMELDLMAAFAANPDRVLSREALLDLAHGKDADPFDRSIDMRINRIRRKVEVDPARPQIIRTVRGAGYIFVTEGHSAAVGHKAGAKLLPD